WSPRGVCRGDSRSDPARRRDRRDGRGAPRGLRGLEEHRSVPSARGASMLRLHDPFDFRVRETPDAEFAVHGARRITYGEAAERVNRLANALLASGLRRGDRVAYLAKNGIEYAIMYYGASKAGV